MSPGRVLGVVGRTARKNGAGNGAGNLWGREPVLVLGAIQTLVALAVSFGLDLTGEQVGATTAASAALLSVVARQKVTPE